MQAVGHNQRGDNIEQQPDPGKDIFLYPLVQLGAGEQLPCQLEQYPHHHQADQQGHSSGEDGTDGKGADGLREEG